MPFFRRRNYRRRGVRRGARRTALRRKTVSKSVKSYVKKAIHRQIENKERLIYGENITLTATSPSTQSIGLLPSMTQGTGDALRIGNQIKIVKGITKIAFNIKPYSDTTNPNTVPVWVRVLLVKNLRLKEASAYINSTDLAQIFRGNATALAQQNNMLDMQLPVNDDLFRVLADRKFKIGASYASATGFVTTQGFFDNSPASKMLTFNWGKYVKSVLKFDDNDANYYPQNNNLFLVMMAVNADGTTNIYSPTEYHYVTSLQYEDA